MVCQTFKYLLGKYIWVEWGGVSNAPQSGTTPDQVTAPEQEKTEVQNIDRMIYFVKLYTFH